MGEKINRMLPFFLLLSFGSLTWFKVLANNSPVLPGHWAGIILLGLNAFLYFLRFSIAIYLTGLILLAATFQLLLYSSELVQKTYFFRIGSAEIATPSIEWKALILFILFCVLNLRFLLKGNGVSK